MSPPEPPQTEGAEPSSPPAGSAVDVEGAPVALPEGKRFDGKLGCLVTLVVGVACVVAAWGIMRVRSAANLDAAAEFAEVVRRAENADGADALRDAGCEQAAVVPMDALRGIAQRLEDDRAAKEKRTPNIIRLGTERVGVVCGSTKPLESLDCAKVGEVFAGAIKNVVLPFVVIVEQRGVAVCTQEYTGDPAAMKDKEPLDLPPLFSARE